MSQYLKYVLERAGVPAANTIVVLRHPLAWVNRQISAEFEALSETAALLVLDNIEGATSDLIVIPYMHEFHSEVPGGLAFYSQLRKARCLRHAVWCRVPQD